MLVAPTPVTSWGVSFIQVKGKSMSLVYRWLCWRQLDMDCWGASRATCPGGWMWEILPTGSTLSSPPCDPFCLEGEKTWGLTARRFRKSQVDDALELVPHMNAIQRASTPKATLHKRVDMVSCSMDVTQPRLQLYLCLPSVLWTRSE